MGGGSILIGAPAYSGSRGVVFQTPLAETLFCPADLNGDGNVNVNDILRVISDWGGDRASRSQWRLGRQRLQICFHYWIHGAIVR